MNVIVRVDSSLVIGTGHVMRCLTLAQELRERGATVQFICRDLPNHLKRHIDAQGYPCHLLPPPLTPSTGSEKDHHQWLGVPWELDAEQTTAQLKTLGVPVDWLVVDHYGIDARWEACLRDVARKILVLDDLVNRPHDCDMILDQNYFPKPDTRYQGLVPIGAERLLGPRHAILRREFLSVKTMPSKQPDGALRLFVFMGGSDPHNVTALVLEALAQIKAPAFSADVLLGPSNPHVEAIQTRAAAYPWARIHRQTNAMASLMAGADLVVGGGGAAAWERCKLALPTVTVVMADNQAHTMEALARTGAIVNAGRYETLRPEILASTIQRLLTQPTERLAMGRAAIALMGGDDFRGAGYVAQRMFELLKAPTVATR